MPPVLDPVQLRALGTLIEKSFTTPQYYPLTTSALLAGCNQATSRDPVTDFDERTMLGALETLRHEHRLVRVIHPSHGRSVDRWRHVIDEALGLIQEEVALLGVLMLRGPQTVAELRTRTERMATFEEPDTVDATLARLANYPEPLARNTGRQPGQSQDRWMHLLGSVLPNDAGLGAPAVQKPAMFETSGDPAPSAPPVGDRIDALERRVAALEAEVAELRGGVGRVASAP